MSDTGRWLLNIGSGNKPLVDGLVYVDDYFKDGKPRQDAPPEEVVVMEKAKDFGATAAIFEAGRDNKPPVAQALIFRADSATDEQHFAETHRRLWSWGGVPLAYRVQTGLGQLFRCAHKPDFVDKGQTGFRPYDTLNALTSIDKAWWDAERLRNGTIWDDPEVCRQLLSRSDSAPRSLVQAIKDLYDALTTLGFLSDALRRKLLILSLLIAYLEDRRVLLPHFFGEFLPGAEVFFQVLADGQALVNMLEKLEERFNGHIFTLSDQERKSIENGSLDLLAFAEFVEGKQTPSGQMTLWRRYSFADLPVELISNIYQLFVQDVDVAVYTPPVLVKLMVGEVLSWERIERLYQHDEVIFDPSCGSGVFLVESYKRLVLHWRATHEWQRPSVDTLKNLLSRIHGVDLEEGAVELAAFSLCLALCDALQPEEIRSTIKLFPELKGATLHASCFFDACEQGKVPTNIGVVLGNPPFTSKLKTRGAQRAYKAYEGPNGRLPDLQVAYLFLHHAMELVREGGVLAMLQQYSFLYNIQSRGFRRDFFERWNVREILDFVSVRGLFTADTKVIVVVAESKRPVPSGKILHATFRRVGRADAEQILEIEYYDMHWLGMESAVRTDSIWRANLLGGGRVHDLTERLRSYRTLGTFAKSREGWDIGEGFIEGAKGHSRDASHIVGKPCLPSEAVTKFGIDAQHIQASFPAKPIKDPKSASRFTPPMLLIRELMDLPRGLWTDGYLTYKNQIVGVCAPESDLEELKQIDRWIDSESTVLRAYVAATSARLFTQKSTVLYDTDIRAIPYPEDRDLDLSDHEHVIARDVVNYYRDLVRLGENSLAMKMRGHEALPEFCRIFVDQINAIYPENKLRALPAYSFTGIICQPFMFGDGDLDWDDAKSLQVNLDALLMKRQHRGLSITRIAKVYDGNVIYLIKPDRLRYWLGSIALLDADETLSDLWRQGF